LKQYKSRGLQKNPQQGRWKERLGFISSYHYDSSPIWIHAVSVGEFISVVPLIELLIQQHPDIPLVITTTTTTGSDQVINKLGNKVFHVYIPWDLPDAMARFYNTIKPRLALIMETEIWPNLLAQAKKRDVPVILINARLSEKSARSYQRIAHFSSSTINYFTHISVQSEADKQRFISLGIADNKLSITGNLKFDLAIKPELIEQSKKIKQLLHWDACNILLASSTHQGEDELVLNLYQQLKPSHPQLKLILVARHPERFKSVEKLARKYSSLVSRRSELDTGLKNRDKGQCDILIGDSLGEMILYFDMANLVIMGGTFIEHGGHNILEPAALGKAIFYGPSMYNFSAINKLFLSNKASIQVEKSEQLVAIINNFLETPEQIEIFGARAKKLFDSNSGSKDRIYQLVKSYLI
jgi:3-deoxy-D-manno-octulosonic-acid transferase